MRRKHDMKSPPDTILFLKLMGLGSLVIASDMMIAVKNKYSNAKVVLLTDSNIGSGIGHFLPGVEIWQLDTTKLVETFFKALIILFRLWRTGTLWVCDLEVYSKLTTIYSLFTCAVNRVGFILHPVQFRNYLNTHNIYYNVYKNLEENYSLIGHALGVSQQELLARNSLPMERMKSNRNYILINNTCSSLSIYRKLPDTTIIEVINWILSNTSFHIVLLGTVGDFEGNEEISSQIDLPIKGNRISNLAGKMTFEEYYSFMEREAVLMISIDSAPLHIAHKLGLPTLSIWGPTNPAHYFKVRETERLSHSFIYKNMFCSPCVHHTAHLPCGGHNLCMIQISQVEIVEALNTLLSTIPQ